MFQVVLLDGQGHRYIPVPDRLLATTMSSGWFKRTSTSAASRLRTARLFLTCSIGMPKPLQSLSRLRSVCFGCRHIPLPTRRHVTAVAGPVQVCPHRCCHCPPGGHSPASVSQHYIALWRALFTRERRDRQAHAYRVPHAAEASSPPLAIAKSRASFLKKLSAAGPT